MSEPPPNLKGPDREPYIPASQSLPEITLKAVLLGAALSAILAAANVYLAAKIGLTVSASIPAAVMSMAVLRVFRDSNILQNNAVQTAASAGESLAAGVVFTVPALVLLGFWNEFHYWTTTSVALCGGLLGVLFTVPLRRALIVEAKLRYPEGVATGHVLKAGSEGGRGARRIAAGALVAAAVKLVQTGFQLARETVAGSVSVGAATFGFSMNLSPALLGIGAIVGPRVAAPLLAGGIVAWLIGVPVVMTLAGPDGVGEVESELREAAIRAAAESGQPAAEVTALDVAGEFFGRQVRFLGVGAMFVGGLYALLSIVPYVRAGVRTALDAVRAARAAGGGESVPRTERDLPIDVVLRGVLVLVLPMLAIMALGLDLSALGVSEGLRWAALGLATVFIVVAGFVFSSVAGYNAGLVGSSNNPVSGVTVVTVLLAALGLLVVLGVQADFEGVAQMRAGAAAAILVGAAVACAAAIAGDNLQDLKAGRIVGATPRRQQVMQILGVVPTAFIVGPVLNLLYRAYGFKSLPELGMPQEQALDTPQADLMRRVAEGVFQGNLPWGMIAIGAALAVAVILLDRILAARGAGVRIPVMAVAVGAYLPIGLGVAVFVGALVAGLAARALGREAAETGLSAAEVVEAGERASRRGLLLGSGLITGEALVGILLAIPFGIAEDQNVLARPIASVLPAGFDPVTLMLGIAAVVGIGMWMYRTGGLRADD